MLTVDPRMRITCAEALKHPWLAAAAQQMSCAAAAAQPQTSTARNLRDLSKMALVKGGSGTLEMDAS